MSNKRVTDAVLPGWNGPFFPEGVPRLQQAFSSCQVCTGAQLEQIGVELGKELGAEVACERPVTEEGLGNPHYTWFWSVVFKWTGKKVAILFPWAQDWGKRNGTQTERCVAVYHVDELSDPVRPELVRKILELFSEKLQAMNKPVQQS
jgi:hypothetical protein